MFCSINCVTLVRSTEVSSKSSSKDTYLQPAALPILNSTVLNKCHSYCPDSNLQTSKDSDSVRLQSSKTIGISAKQKLVQSRIELETFCVIFLRAGEHNRHLIVTIVTTTYLA